MKKKDDAKDGEMMETSSLFLLLAGGALFLIALYVLYKLIIFFVHGWEVLVYLLILKNGLPGLILMALLFVVALPLAIFLTLYLGYRDQKNENRFWRNVDKEIKKRRNEG